MRSSQKKKQVNCSDKSRTKNIFLLYTIFKFITSHPLNSNRKLKALLTFLCWQIGSRLISKKVVVPWVDSAKFVSGLGESGLTGNIYAGLTEFEDMLFLLHALDPNSIFIDIGANAGAYTILASKVVKSRAIAFEPLPETIKRLNDQISINNLHGIVDVRNVGVADVNGSLFFTNNSDTVNKVCLTGSQDNTTRVNVVTLDNELNVNEKYFLKIDVEGFEYNVIQGASKILSKDNIDAIIIELNGSGDEFGYTNEDVHLKILSFGFTSVRYEPFTRVLSKLDGYNKSSGNTIYIKDFDRIAQRCKLAPRRIIHTANKIDI